MVYTWRLSGRPRRRWDDNIIMDCKGIAIDTRNWFVSTQYVDGWTVMVKKELNLGVL